MREIDTSLILRLIREEIEHLVARARDGQGFIRAEENAYRIMRAYPNSGLSGTEVVNQIIGEAAAAGVAVEIRQPYPAKQVA